MEDLEEEVEVVLVVVVVAAAAVAMVVTVGWSPHPSCYRIRFFAPRRKTFSRIL